MPKKPETELKVGLFLSAGVGLIMIAILVLGGTQDFFSGKNHYYTHFKNVEGLITGAKVILGGVSVGTVESIEFNNQERNIQVQYSVRKGSTDWIRKDSTAEIATQGVLGDKYININAGSEDQPILPPSSQIQNRPTKDLNQFLNKSDQLVGSLNSIANTLDRILKSFESDNRSEVFFRGMASSAKNLSQATDKFNQQMDHLQLKNAMANMNQILEKVNNGSGTVGALINDSGLYDEMRALMGGANRNRVLRNLVRQTIKDSEENAASNQPQKSKPSK